MAHASTNSAALLGIQAVPITVEVDVSNGLPSFVVVGLPDAAVQEARDRIRAAFRNNGLPFPQTRVTVNLAPAAIRKQGSSYDLPIAVALLRAVGALPAHSGKNDIFIGELALGGNVRGVSGAVPYAELAVKRRVALYVPHVNAPEASFVPVATVYPVASLEAVLAHLRGSERIVPLRRADVLARKEATPLVELSSLRGQAHAKRALEIAAAGNHNVLLRGSPGSGKTMLARALPGILPPPSSAEQREVLAIASVAGRTRGVADFPPARPFRAPHHSVSLAAFTGGGAYPRPGEITLAHRGVLFLDELPEFSRAVLESLREPMEDGVLAVSRANGAVRFPARFLLVAAHNPCPCGYDGDPSVSCCCTAADILRYKKKISGPLLDRMDLVVSVPRLAAEEFFSEAPEEPTSTVRERVRAARARQSERQSGCSNAELPHDGLISAVCLTKEAGVFVRAAAASLTLTARGYARTLRVARTIADLAGAERTDATHVAEALTYRAATTAAPAISRTRTGSPARTRSPSSPQSAGAGRLTARCSP